jgi:hypothetical protein
MYQRGTACGHLLACWREWIHQRLGGPANVGYDAGRSKAILGPASVDLERLADIKKNAGEQPSLALWGAST